MEEKPSSKKRVLFPLLFVFIALLLVGGLFWWIKEGKQVWTNDAYVEGFNVSLSADIEARLIKLHVDEGDFVRCGDLICDLDRSILNAQKKEAKSEVALLAKKVDLEKFHLEKITDDLKVAKQEYEKQIISYLDFDHAEKDYLMAQASYEMAVKEWENAQAKLQVILAKLKHTQVFAPRNGMIAKRWILAGDVVQFGQPLFELHDLKNLWVTANLEETKLKGVRIGSPVKIHIDAYPDQVFTGKVFVIKASAASKFALIPPDNATGNFTKVVQRIPVKISIETPKDLENFHIFPGMSCEVTISIR